MFVEEGISYLYHNQPNLRWQATDKPGILPAATGFLPMALLWKNTYLSLLNI
jgi:hypothetical protein